MPEGGHPQGSFQQLGTNGGGGGCHTSPPFKRLGPIFLPAFGQSQIFPGAFGASQFRPKLFFGFFGVCGVSRNSHH